MGDPEESASKQMVHRILVGRKCRCVSMCSAAPPSWPMRAPQAACRKGRFGKSDTAGSRETCNCRSFERVGRSFDESFASWPTLEPGGTHSGCGSSVSSISAEPLTLRLPSFPCSRPRRPVFVSSTPFGESPSAILCLPFSERASVRTAFKQRESLLEGSLVKIPCPNCCDC